MKQFTENLFKRLMYLYRKEGNQAFGMAAGYFAFFVGSIVILFIFFPLYLFMDIPYAIADMDYLERKGRLVPIALPLYFLLIYIVRKIFRKFKDCNPNDYKDIWSDTNFFHIWLIWIISFLIIFYTNIFLHENV
jgi:hypothetical protein